MKTKPGNLIATVRLLIGLSAAHLLASCATPGAVPGAPNAAAPSAPAVVRIPRQPTLDSREQGLLVGAIAGRAVASNYFERLWFLRAVLKINGVSYVGAINDGYLALPLKVGDYELQALETQKNASDKNMTSYPIHIKFRVQAGQATNLGLIVLTRGAGEGKFHRSIIDNTADITERLKHDQRGLFDALDPQAPVVTVSDTVYLKGQAIEQLQRDIARDAFTRSDADTKAAYTYGELGTIAKAVRDSQQRVVGFEALHTGTYASMFSCAGQSDRYVCSSVEPALYLVHGTQVDQIKLPSPSLHWWVDAFAPAGIALVDENMSIFRSQDDGRTWTKSSWFAVKEPLKPTTRIKSYNGKSGFYLYSVDKIDPLAPVALYSNYIIQDSYTKVDMPDLAVWDTLIEVKDTLFVGPAFSSSKDHSLVYVRLRGSNQWEERQLPDINCQNLQRPDDSDDVTVLCSRKRYRSHDQGRTWWPEENSPASVTLN
jgi:hypothetical protein